MLFLLRLWLRKCGLYSPPLKARNGSPPRGRSILITSAPRSASIIAACGAVTNEPSSEDAGSGEWLHQVPRGEADPAAPSRRGFPPRSRLSRSEVDEVARRTMSRMSVDVGRTAGARRGGRDRRPRRAAGIEVYMLRRSAPSRAFPDAYVFPGGAVDDDDRSPLARVQLAGPWRPDGHEFTYAAIRETFEECGLLFADAAGRRGAAARGAGRAPRQERARSPRSSTTSACASTRAPSATSRGASRRRTAEHPFRRSLFRRRVPREQHARGRRRRNVRRSLGRAGRDGSGSRSADAARILPPTVLYLRRLAQFDGHGVPARVRRRARTVEPDRRP